MTRMSAGLAGTLLIAMTVLLPAQTQIQVGQTIQGTLGPGDSQLPSGEYYDQYVFQGQAGQTYSIRMDSSAFDTYLIFMDPSNAQQDNDDMNGTNAGLDVTLTSSGQCQIGATSYSAGETGAYTVSLSAGAPAPVSPPAPTTMPSTPTTTPSSPTTMPSTPTTMPSTPTAQPAAPAWPTPPAAPPAPPQPAWPTPPPAAPTPGTQPAPAVPPAPAPAPGQQVAPTTPGMPAAPAAPTGPMANGGPINVGQTVTGQLMAGDPTLPTGEFCDTYTLNVTAGQRLSIRAASSDFDTYLIFRDPSGSQQDNDDFGDDLNSGLDIAVTGNGTAQIGVTSYASGATGTYTLSVN